MAAFTTDNGEIWRELDHDFYEIKKSEDVLRKKIPNFSRDLLTYESLVPLDEVDMIGLRSTMKKSMKNNSMQRDPQLRSFNRDTSLTIASKSQIIKDPLNEKNDFDRLILKKIDELPFELRNHVVVAGGSILTLIQGFGWSSDIDLFIVGTQKPKQVVGEILELWKNEIVYANRTQHSITLSMKLKFTIQFILRLYRTPAEVVIGFDLDASGCCYHMGKFFCTPRALHSMKTMRLRVDIDRMSETYAYRLVKYGIKKGFSIWIPIPLTVTHLNESLLIYSDQFKSIRSKRLNDSLIGLLVHQYHQRRITNRADGDGIIFSDYCEIENELDQDVKSGIFFEKNEKDKVVSYRFDTYGISIEAILDLEKFRDRLPPNLEFEIGWEADWIVKNPGTQFTASFHPIDMTWEKWMRTTVHEELITPQ